MGRRGKLNRAFCLQGYAISEEEIRVSLDDFKAMYAPARGNVECVRGLGRRSGRDGADGVVFCSKSQISFKAARPEGDEIYIFYSDEASVGIKTMRK